MRCFEIVIATSEVSKSGGPFVPTNQLFYAIPEEAEDLLKPILSVYGQNPTWYFDGLNFGRPPAPWALACLDREYALAGHVATSRPPNAGILFAPYQTPKPVPDDFVPGVGVLVFQNKNGLGSSAGNSPLFTAAWNALRECSADRRWLAILDPLSQNWLTQVLPDDRDRWLTSLAVSMANNN